MISRWLEIGKKRVSAGKNEQVPNDKRVSDDRCNAQNASVASIRQQSREQSNVDNDVRSETVTEKGDGQIQVLEEEKQEIQREVSSMIKNANENTSNKLNGKKFIKHFYRNGRHYVRCEPCF